MKTELFFIRFDHTSHDLTIVQLNEDELFVFFARSKGRVLKTLRHIECSISGPYSSREKAQQDIDTIKAVQEIAEKGLRA